MGLSYHDVYLKWGDNPEVRLFDTYAVTLSCSRVGGWSLWTTGERPVEVAGEYHDVPLRIRVGDMVILNTFPKEAADGPEQDSGAE